ncbi:flagellar protein FlgN [Ruania rhizosphaerae]|uniref:flagellar protein FlgN n=1 Tax=Ruania rhizosphaerae TaxID=1840413 RepID=UPI0013569C21|nr:flagellar protein FlgN [Ruania rhizosphaerae]
MADIYLSLDELRTANDQLTNIVEEFENAVSRSEALERAIGAPFSKTELREKAEDFETRWDVKRDKLKEGLSDVQKHLKGVIDGVEEWDAEAAIKLTPEA